MNEQTATCQVRKPSRRVHVMAEYTSTVLWDHDGAPLDPTKVPLSPKLRVRLDRWRARFEASFDREIDLEAFAAEGHAIARAVKAELPDWTVIYFDEAAAAGAAYRGSRAAYETEIS